MDITYTGQFDRVMVPALGGRVVEKGETVPAPHDEVAASLVRSGNWEYADAQEKPADPPKTENPPVAPSAPAEASTPKDEPNGATSADSAAPADVPATTAPAEDTAETVDDPSAKDIRVWAISNGIDVPARGAISADVRAKYDAAHAAGKADTQ